MATVPGLYTTVRNTSGATAVFGFLGLHGKRLANNETFTVPGDLVAALGGQRSQRKFKALERALADGDIVITASPAVYLTDSADDSIDQLAVSSDSVTPTSPEGWD